MELAKRAEVSDKAAITHYDTVLNRELEQASKEHSRALSEGDYESATEAQKKIAAATAKIEQAKSWEAQENWRNEQENIRRQQEQSLYEKQAQEQEYIINQENNARLQNTEAWVSKNPWYNEGSKDYNPDLFNKVEEFTEELEEYFHSRGESYLIGSGTYFKAIDKKVSELSNNSPKRSISMSRNNYMSTPVRSSSQSKQTSSPLTPLQKQYAKMFGASEADYVKNRKHDIDNGKAYSHGRAVGRMQNSFKI